ncbi:MAG TPA: hypothetical protein VFZ49_04365 [Pyrinomonadaceae bacterium]
MTAREHNRLISIFFHIQGAIQVLAGVIIVLVYAGMGTFFLAASRREEEMFVGGIFVVLAIVIGAIVLALAAVDFYAAFKIGKVQKIGRTLGIVLAILSLLSFPLGTALGVYALWFFFGDDGKALYNIDGAGANVNYHPPPPPNSWQ